MFERVDFSAEPANLPPSLIEAIEADDGLWYASDYHTDAASVVARAREIGAVALRLDFRDLSLLEQLPQVRYLHLRSDGRPRLEPLAGLAELRALILHVSALSGELDVRGSLSSAGCAPRSAVGAGRRSRIHLRAGT